MLECSVKAFHFPVCGEDADLRLRSRDTPWPSGGAVALGFRVANQATHVARQLFFCLSLAAILINH